MEYHQAIKIGYHKGVHTRVAAAIVQKSSALEKEWGCRLYIRRDGQSRTVPCNSVLPLVGMKLMYQDRVIISGDGISAQEAVSEMAAFIQNSEDVSGEDAEAIDSIMQENTLTSETIFGSIANGLIVIDAEGIVTIFNKAAEGMTGINADAVIGKRADQAVPGIEAQDLEKMDQSRRGIKAVIGECQMIVDWSPVMVGGLLSGAVAVLQDISQLEKLSWELSSVKELEGKLISILEAAYNGICLIDTDHKITYVNEAFAAMLKCRVSELTEVEIRSIFSGEKIPDAFPSSRDHVILKNPDGREFVLDSHPISVDGHVSGNAIVARELTEIAKLAELVETLSAQTDYLKKELAKGESINPSFQTIIGKSSVLMAALRLASRAARTDVSVLIRGESGTGKELVARAIHNASPRKSAPFVGVNCAAIPAELLESELFGHEKGAFTGAVREKPGKFELANGGTIFLDEIGDMDVAMQAKLLRVLQEQEIERVGGLHPVKIDVRIVAATNAPLEKLMQENAFRPDLYYRLNVVSVVLPPLRERLGDIPLLTAYFTDKVCRRYSLPEKKVARRALRCLAAYDYPGNVRELENIIERGVTLSDSEWIEVTDLPVNVTGGEFSPEKPQISWENGEELPKLEELERLLIGEALKRYKTFRQVGKALGVDHKTISAKVKKYKIS